MSALDALKTSLSTVNARFASIQLGDPKAMRSVAEKLERVYGMGRAPDPELVQKTLRYFVQTRMLAGYRDIKNVCYGTLVPIDGGRTLASNLANLQSLLGVVDQYNSDPKKLKRCFQALMGAYLSLDGCESDSKNHAQWDTLRQRLAGWLPQLSNIQPQPDWLAAAFEHRNLFSNDRTSRYGVKILNGDLTDFESACERLGIDLHSWVRRRVVISAVEAATRERDSQFLSYLDQLVDLLRRNEGVRDEGAALLLNRHAQQAIVTEHVLLRAFAIDVFGNPLITANRQRWFEVSQEAREMVTNWLKGFLIERFFELLSQDGHTDKRRPKFWLRYRGSIENMWFILGTSATSNWNSDFKKLRQTMGNQCLSLEGTSAKNNAFVLKIGNLYVVEFGEKGNAAFLFRLKDVPPDLMGKQLHISQLKSNHEERMLHIDGRESWESKFSDTLTRYSVHPDSVGAIGRRTTRATTVARTQDDIATPSYFRQVVKQFCNERGLPFNDREPGGRFVVYADSSNSVISGKLGQWGFKYDRELQQWNKNP